MRHALAQERTSADSRSGAVVPAQSALREERGQVGGEHAGPGQGRGRDGEEPREQKRGEHRADLRRSPDGAHQRADPVGRDESRHEDPAPGRVGDVRDPDDQHHRHQEGHACGAVEQAEEPRPETSGAHGHADRGAERHHPGRP